VRPIGEHEVVVVRELALRGLLVLPFVVAAVVVALHPELTAWPSADWALLESRVLAACRGDLLLGAYSRFGFRHPGPLPYYVWSPFYAALGQNTVLLHVASGVCNLAWFIVAWTYGARETQSFGRRLALAVVLLAFVAAYADHLRFGDALTEFYNPTIAGFPLLALYVLSLRMSRNEFSAVPLGILAHAFAVQAHIGVTIVASVWLCAGIVGWLRSDRSSRGVWTRTTIACAVAFVLWAPPLVDVATNSPDNLDHMVTAFRRAAAAGGSNRDPERFQIALHALAGPTTGLLAGVGVGFKARLFVGTSVLALALSWIFLITKRRGSMPRASLRAGSGLLAAALPIAVLPGPVGPYMFVAYAAVGASCFVGILLDAPAGLTERFSASARTAMLWAAAGALAAASARASIAQISQRAHVERARGVERATRWLSCDAVQPPAYVMRLAGPDAWRLGAGVALALAKQGSRVSLTPGQRYRFDSPFHHEPDAVGEVNVLIGRAPPRAGRAALKANDHFVSIERRDCRYAPRTPVADGVSPDCACARAE
jgi:hypothetical protein